MNCEYRVYPDLSLGVVWLRDEIAAPDILEVFTRLCADEHWRPDFSTLWDARGVTRLVIELADINLLTECAERSRNLGPGRIAILVGREIEYQILSLILVQRNVRARVPKVFFRSEEALGWLGVPDGLNEIPAHA